MTVLKTSIIAVCICFWSIARFTFTIIVSFYASAIPNIDALSRDIITQLDQYYSIMLILIVWELVPMIVVIFCFRVKALHRVVKRAGSSIMHGFLGNSNGVLRSVFIDNVASEDEDADDDDQSETSSIFVIHNYYNSHRRVSGTTATILASNDQPDYLNSCTSSNVS